MVMKILVIAGVILAGFFLIAHPFPVLHPVLPPTADRRSSIGLLTAFGAAMIPVLFAYGGWQTSNFVAGEIRDPRRNLTRALMIGVAGVIVLYVAVNAVCVRALGAEGLAADDGAGDRGDAARARCWGREAGGLRNRRIDAWFPEPVDPHRAACLLRHGAGWAVLPQRGADHPKKTRVPAVAIVLQSCWTAVIALSGSYEQILNYVVSMNFVFFGLSATCLFILRRPRRAGSAGAPAEVFACRAIHSRH